VVAELSREELLESNGKLSADNAELRRRLEELTLAHRGADAPEEREHPAGSRLKSLVAPEGDIDTLELSDIIDIPALQSLVDDFYQLSRMPMSLTDCNGKVLVGAGWQKICTEYHRVNPDTCRNCIESDLLLSDGVPMGRYTIYKCKNNMWDVATPVLLGNRRVGNLFMGQFFFEDEPLDYELFRAKARQYGFDEKEYLAALEAVPRLSRQSLNTGMSFYMKLAEVLSSLCFSNLKLARSLSELDTLLLSLHQNEQRLQLFIEHAPAALAMFDTEMRYLSVSRRWINEYRLGDRNLIGLSHYEVFPEIPHQWREAHRRGLAGEVLREEADRFERADGSLHWLRWEIRPWYDGRKIGGIVIFTEFVTDLKLAEEELRNSENKFSILFHQASLPAALSRPPHHEYVDVNDAWLQLFGYAKEEVIGRTSYQLGIARDADPLRAAASEVSMHAPVLDQEQTLFAKSGAAHTVLSNINPIKIAGQDFAFSSMQDITLRKQAETALMKANESLEARVKERTTDLYETLDSLSAEIAVRRGAEERLRQSEERYRKVVADQTETICRFNAAGQFIFVNEVFCRIFGKTQYELMGNSWQPSAVPEDVPMIEARLREMSPANPVVVIENRIHDGSGAVRWMQFVNRGFFDTQGRLVETQAVGRDITGRKQAELVLADIRDGLELQVKERTQSLMETNLQLQQEVADRLEMETELVQKNQMLESMAIELSLAEERERARIAGELHDQVGQRLIFGKMKLDALVSYTQDDGMLAEVEELRGIVDLSIQDIRSLTFQLRPPLLSSAGLEAALHWLGDEFQETYGLRFSFSDDGNLKPMRYEARSTVFQAAREVLLNSVKHAGATRFGIDIGREGALLQLYLSDDGCGFDPAAARAKKTKSGGFGLSNVQRRIEHLGGSLTIDSRPGRGTRITILAPLDLSPGT
jgi:PAS domain S-box-containing protein